MSTEQVKPKRKVKKWSKDRREKYLAWKARQDAQKAGKKIKETYKISEASIVSVAQASVDIDFEVISSIADLGKLNQKSAAKLLKLYLEVKKAA